MIIRSGDGVIQLPHSVYHVSQPGRVSRPLLIAELTERQVSALSMLPPPQCDNHDFPRPGGLLLAASRGRGCLESR